MRTPLVVVLCIATGMGAGIAATLAGQDAFSTSTTRTTAFAAVDDLFVTSHSMVPTILPRASLGVNLSAYQDAAPQPGDVITFFTLARTAAACHLPVHDPFVARVIATPGQYVYSIGNTIYVDYTPLRQRWPHTRQLGQPIVRQYVPTASYFVMGDDRTASCDSRDWGDVPASDLVGKVVSVTNP